VASKELFIFGRRGREGYWPTASRRNFACTYYMDSIERGKELTNTLMYFVHVSDLKTLNMQ
jgi:hypothetical protein